MPRPLAIEILDAIVTSYRAHRSHVEDDGPSIDRDFEIGDFERLDVAGPMDVEVRTGAAASVQASGPEWALENLRVEQQDDRLLIGCEGDIDSDVTVVVTVPRLAAARLSGSGDVSIDSIKGDAFECSSSGSGDLSVDEIARRLDIPAGTVQSRLHYALKRLHAAIDTADGEESIR